MPLVCLQIVKLKYDSLISPHERKLRRTEKLMFEQKAKQKK